MNLTIVTSCTRYGPYLLDWTQSIISQTSRPEAVAIFTHGADPDRVHGRNAVMVLNKVGIPATHEHNRGTLDFGVARNRAVALSKTEWVMHLDADDMLLPHAVADFRALAPEADVISAGYICTGPRAMRISRQRVYQDATGLRALQLPAICSGISPFRRALWEQTPYRTDMLGAWDTALWIGFARLGARFRATKRAVFKYRQHDDSIFNQRRRLLNWARVRTTAQLKALRRAYTGVDVIFPLTRKLSPRRQVAYEAIREHYTHHHPEWGQVAGYPSGVAWSKGEAIANAVSQSSAEVLVIADADCLVNPSQLRETVAAIVSGAAPWGMPHRMVYRASAAATERICAAPVEDRWASRVVTLDRNPYEGAPGGGIVVMRRMDFDAIGGMPPAFRGWGSEDRALACAAETLLGPCLRGPGDLLHLWHDPQVKGSQPASNLQLLRLLGHAAQKGKDALVSVIYTLPAPGSTRFLPHLGTARPTTQAAQLIREHVK